MLSSECVGIIYSGAIQCIVCYFVGLASAYAITLVIISFLIDPTTKENSAARHPRM